MRWMRVRGDGVLPGWRMATWYGCWAGHAGWCGCGSERCVVFRHAVYGVLINRVVELQPAAGTLTVRGTRPVSLDSQEFGPVPLRDVLGKVIWTVHKA